MPKLNNTHLPQRIQEHIEKMERGEEVEAKKDKTLLSALQQQALKDALEAQKVLKKTHRRPKTKEEKDKIGWKEIREVRLEIYKQALQALNDNALDDFLIEIKKRKVRETRVFMDAWCQALDEGKRGESAVSAGNIALQRAGFKVSSTVSLSKRDREIRDMEDALRKQFEAQASDAEKEQLAILREHEKALEKKKK